MKKVILIVLACMTVSNSSRAQVISGKFVEFLSLDGATTLTFSKGNFTYFRPDDVSNKYGIGNFKIKDSLLRLNFKTVPNQDSSFYTIKTTKPKSPDSLFFSIKITDESDPPPSGEVTFTDKEFLSLKSFDINRSERISFSIPKNLKFDWLILDNFSSYRVKIPYSKLKKCDAQIVVNFKIAKTYYMWPQTIVYKIKKLEGKELVLSNGKREWKFKKVN